jgi:hypothetical protein
MKEFIDKSSLLKNLPSPSLPKSPESLRDLVKGGKEGFYN